MGNISWNTQQFPYSKDQWIRSQNPHILICPTQNTQAHFQTIQNPTEHDIKCYQLRCEYNECLVSVLAVFPQTTNFNVKCEKGLKYKVLIQKVEYRLPDLGSLTLKDGLYIIKQGIRAIKALSLLFDNFQFEEQAIGIDSEGKCKYWINSNFFTNTVQTFHSEKHEIKINQNYENLQQLQLSNPQSFCFINNFSKQNKNQFSNFFQIKTRNISKTLQSLFLKIFQKMRYQLTVEEAKLLTSAMDDYFCQNIENMSSSQNVFPSIRQFKTLTNLHRIYIYSFENIQKLVNHLYRVLDVKQNHRINIPQRDKNKIQKIRLNKLKQSPQKNFKYIFYRNISSNNQKNKKQIENEKKFQLNLSKTEFKNKRQDQENLKTKNHKFIPNFKTSLKKIKNNDAKLSNDSNISDNDDTQKYQEPRNRNPIKIFNINSHHDKTIHSINRLSEINSQFQFVGTQNKHFKNYCDQLKQNHGSGSLKKDQIAFSQSTTKTNCYTNKMFYENIRKDNGFSQITVKSTANSYTSNFYNTNSQFNLQSRKISFYGQPNNLFFNQNKSSCQNQQEHLFYEPKVISPKANILHQNLQNNSKITFSTSSPFHQKLTNYKNTFSSTEAHNTKKSNEGYSNMFNSLSIIEYRYQDQPVDSNPLQPSKIKPNICITYIQDENNRHKVLGQEGSLNNNFKPFF